MSTATRRLTARAELQGWTVDHIEWEAIRAGGEKSGPEGGWDIYLSRDGKTEWAGGYNVEQALQWIKNLDAGWGVDPFSCSGKAHSLGPDDCLMARGHRGDCETKRSRGLVAVEPAQGGNG